MHTVGRLIVDSLVAHGIDRVFCVPGESYLGLLDGLYGRADVDTVTCRHEAGRTLCSNTGIACEHQAVECVRSEAEEGGKPESKKPEN